jgi:hypothetical protein
MLNPLFGFALRYDAIRQDHPKTDHSVRRIGVPPFAAAVVRSRLAVADPDPQRTIFTNRTGGPLSPCNVRRTSRAFLEAAGLAGQGITPRWYRRTGATAIARGASTDAAATFLGRGSTAITEGHYIEPDRTIDHNPASRLERTLRPVSPDHTLLRHETTLRNIERSRNSTSRTTTLIVRHRDIRPDDAPSSDPSGLRAPADLGDLRLWASQWRVRTSTECAHSTATCPGSATARSCSESVGGMSRRRCRE